MPDTPESSVVLALRLHRRRRVLVQRLVRMHGLAILKPAHHPTPPPCPRRWVGLSGWRLVSAIINVCTLVLGISTARVNVATQRVTSPGGSLSQMRPESPSHWTATGRPHALTPVDTSQDPCNPAGQGAVIGNRDLHLDLGYDNAARVADRRRSDRHHSEFVILLPCKSNNPSSHPPHPPLTRTYVHAASSYGVVSRCALWSITF